MLAVSDEGKGPEDDKEGDEGSSILSNITPYKRSEGD